MKEIKNLAFWHWLTNFWSLLTLLFFVLAFINPGQFNGLLVNVSIIYGAILAIYVSNKEITRWHNKQFTSKYYGEVFVFLWTIVMITFIIIASVNGKYSISPEFTAIYITILGIFAIGQKSKALKNS
ncbi:MAG: hypothetical protein CO073_02255 [Candidatus Komeilibacteria bacterium CG_4_9_14_0_8_um_filter_36_9]|uniref:Uncharacterized protein n=1 Tax=Candidatus Komeilibacteria bacterium CG_4_9_14_0_8_um_filter_36_9 TaxID=1974473 RepID=A0A2M8DRA0_9BACT|nr:MAG: hypothetical protein CO073_02255 [Candidatus Komeilibacteria bacterium CG_4_9_14_0_8_um_filter_36_9]